MADILYCLVFRTDSDLVKFLKVHNGDNFVKTHGADINKLVYPSHSCDTNHKPQDRGFSHRAPISILCSMLEAV